MKKFLFLGVTVIAALLLSSCAYLHTGATPGGNNSSADSFQTWNNYSTGESYQTIGNPDVIYQTDANGNRSSFTTFRNP